MNVRVAARLAGALLVTAALVLVSIMVVYRVPDRPVEVLAQRWAPAPSTFIGIGGMSVHVRDTGPRSDPVPLVLLHGTGASLHTWDGWAQALEREHRVIRFDLPGFGLTGPTPDGVYTIDRYVETVLAVADALRVRRFTLAGNSLGGYVAWATAVLHPERIERLILVDAAGYAYRSQAVPLAFRLARTPVLGALLEEVLPRRIVESSVREVFGDPAKVRPELVDRYFDLATRKGNRKALVARFEQTRPGALAGRVPELRVPTLILWGGRDRLIPLESGERFAQEIPGSRLVVFERLGHVPQEEDPAATVATVVEFLDFQ